MNCVTNPKSHAWQRIKLTLERHYIDFKYPSILKDDKLCHSIPKSAHVSLPQYIKNICIYHRRPTMRKFPIPNQIREYKPQNILASTIAVY